ncbi:hypothetical protein LEP1GSC188_2264 [Leptospira weilii serovar Topaz str. LT2116]|uniref:Uncharacterized protein n=1 Tax=Leptospira weilii serovar Topaz str. LT2116 TaxID=1088540 RepID=M3GXY6_9LEPT|nr:hypothetical protein LEP1GSC188_2264 [Leptospira weilii serovar Topaz str. LT2116]
MVFDPSGLSTSFCNNIFPREKYLEGDGCKNRAENCMAGLAIVKGM